jgi:cytochrome c oxidase subunit 2
MGKQVKQVMARRHSVAWAGGQWCWRVPRWATVLGVALLGAGCGESPSTLNPQGPHAARLADVWWFLLMSATVVFVVVMALFGYALLRSTRPDRAESVMRLDHARFIIIGGAVIPTIIILIVFIVTMRALAWFSEPPEEPTVSIEVVGWMWWWEVRYPNEGIVTANEVRIPAGEYVEIRTTAADVIHSVWPSELAGKIDSTPGEWKSIWLRADEPGIYRGQCAEYCGDQHTNMDFLVIAQPPEEFAAWVAARQQPLSSPASAAAERGQQVFHEAQCGFCHLIAGTEFVGVVGPALTDLAARQTLGSALVANDRATLAAWIIDPHQIKPGVKMPPTFLNPEDLNALLDYLETLQ